MGAVRTPFIYDDNRMVVENLAIRDLSNLRAVLILEATRPILNLSYAIDYAIFGSSAPGFHATNVLLHAMNVVLLFLLAWRLAEDEEPSTGPAVRPQIVALTAAVLFAVHPMMTESVTYVAGRSEVLCTTFFLLAFFAARRWMLGGARVWWLTAIACWVAALGTKEIAAMLPFVLLAYERWVLRGRVDRPAADSVAVARAPHRRGARRRHRPHRRAGAGRTPWRRGRAVALRAGDHRRALPLPRPPRHRQRPDDLPLDSRAHLGRSADGPRHRPARA